MTTRPPQAALGRIGALLLVCLAIPISAQERVEARLSAQSLPAGQPVELTLTATSEDATLGAPDLSVLEPDFQVLDRRVERRVSVTNGRRREELRLRLMLLPQRAGALRLPGIPFGSARSQPLTLTVEPGSSEAQEPASGQTGRGTVNLDPRIFEQPDATGPSAPPPEWSWGVPPAAAPSLSPFSYPFAGPPLDGSQMDLATALPPLPETPQVSSPPAPAPKPAPGTAANPWFWVSLGLAAALLGLLFSRRRAERTPAPGPTKPSLDTEPPPDPLAEALERVRDAYRHGDGGAAREALLAWGRLRWPNDPPGNLARLARRFPPPLREHITELEKAFFSPEPIHWEREPVADALSRDWTAQSTASGQAREPSGAAAA